MCSFIVLMNRKKGNIFEGAFSGALYDRITSLAGFDPSLYGKVAKAIPLRPGMKVVDLGCGTGALSVPVAQRVGDEGRVIGIDLSARQLKHARHKTGSEGLPLEYQLCSMDELPFEDSSIDAVVSGMSFHEVPHDVRVGAIRETARVLRPDGFFALMDWSRPRFGLLSLLWLPLVLFESSGDNWRNAYPAMCAEHGLTVETDTYLNSLVRCQVFRLTSDAQGHKGVK